MKLKKLLSYYDDAEGVTPGTIHWYKKSIFFRFMMNKQMLNLQGCAIYIDTTHAPQHYRIPCLNSISSLRRGSIMSY